MYLGLAPLNLYHTTTQTLTMAGEQTDNDSTEATLSLNESLAKAYNSNKRRKRGKIPEPLRVRAAVAYVLYDLSLL